MQKISLAQKLLLIVFGIVLCLILLEIGMRAAGFIYLSAQEYRNWVSLKQKGAYRILCLGESTTALGDKDSYPRQLEGILNQYNIGIKFSVINKGIPATNTTVILSDLEKNIAQYRPDMVITMTGVNDGGTHMAYKEKNSVEKNSSFFTSLKIYTLAKFIYLHILSKEKEFLGIHNDSKYIRGVLQGNLQSCPKDYRGYIDLAFSYKTNQDFAKAEAMFKKAIELNPKNDSGYFHLGWCYKDDADYVNAERAFKKAIELNPKNSGAHMALGWIYKEKGDCINAEQAFKRAIEVDPKDDKNYNGLGWLYDTYGCNDPVKAEEMFKKAIELNPKDSGAYMGLGWCYRRNSDYANAEKAFKKAIELDPENDKAYSNLAMLYNEFGNYQAGQVIINKLNSIMLQRYNPLTRYNYQKLKNIVTGRRIKLVCVQYPVRGIEPLKKMFESQEGIIFVDNEEVFKEALKTAKYSDYFQDIFAGDFGHCTPKGNRLLAGNIAKVILKEVFKK